MDSSSLNFPYQDFEAIFTTRSSIINNLTINNSLVMSMRRLASTNLAICFQTLKTYFVYLK